MTIEELAQYLEIEAEEILALVQAEKIPFIKDSSSFRFERDKIDQWAVSGKVDGHV